MQRKYKNTSGAASVVAGQQYNRGVGQRLFETNASIAGIESKFRQSSQVYVKHRPNENLWTVQMKTYVSSNQTLMLVQALPGYFEDEVAL